MSALVVALVKLYTVFACLRKPPPCRDCMQDVFGLLIDLFIFHRPMTGMLE